MSRDNSSQNASQGLQYLKEKIRKFNERPESEEAIKNREALQKAAEERAAKERAAEERAIEERGAEEARKAGLLVLLPRKTAPINHFVQAMEKRAAEERAAKERAAEERAAKERAAKERSIEERAAEEARKAGLFVLLPRPNFHHNPIGISHFNNATADENPPEAAALDDHNKIRRSSDALTMENIIYLGNEYLLSSQAAQNMSKEFKAQFLASSPIETAQLRYIQEQDRELALRKNSGIIDSILQLLISPNKDNLALCTCTFIDGQPQAEINGHWIALNIKKHRNADTNFTIEIGVADSLAVTADKYKSRAYYQIIDDIRSLLTDANKKSLIEFIGLNSEIFKAGSEKYNQLKTFCENNSVTANLVNIPCSSQGNSDSCGYHAVYNAVTMYNSPSLVALDLSNAEIIKNFKKYYRPKLIKHFGIEDKKVTLETKTTPTKRKRKEETQIALPESDEDERIESKKQTEDEEINLLYSLFEESFTADDAKKGKRAKHELEKEEMISQNKEKEEIIGRVKEILNKRKFFPQGFTAYCETLEEEHKALLLAEYDRLIKSFKDGTLTAQDKYSPIANQLFFDFIVDNVATNLEIPDSYLKFANAITANLTNKTEGPNPEHYDEDIMDHDYSILDGIGAVPSQALISRTFSDEEKRQLEVIYTRIVSKINSPNEQEIYFRAIDKALTGAAWQDEQIYILLFNAAAQIIFEETDAMSVDDEPSPELIAEIEQLKSELKKFANNNQEGEIDLSNPKAAAQYQARIILAESCFDDFLGQDQDFMMSTDETEIIDDFEYADSAKESMQASDIVANLIADLLLVGFDIKKVSLSNKSITSQSLIGEDPQFNVMQLYNLFSKFPAHIHNSIDGIMLKKGLPNLDKLRNLLDLVAQFTGIEEGSFKDQNDETKQKALRLLSSITSMMRSKGLPDIGQLQNLLNFVAKMIKSESTSFKDLDQPSEKEAARLFASITGMMSRKGLPDLGQLQNLLNFVAEMIKNENTSFKDLDQPSKKEATRLFASIAAMMEKKGLPDLDRLQTILNFTTTKIIGDKKGDGSNNPSEESITKKDIICHISRMMTQKGLPKIQELQNIFDSIAASIRDNKDGIFKDLDDKTLKENTAKLFYLVIGARHYKGLPEPDELQTIINENMEKLSHRIDTTNAKQDQPSLNAPDSSTRNPESSRLSSPQIQIRSPINP